MDIPAKKLVKLLSVDDASVRAAAILISAELGLKDAEANAELLERLLDDDAAVRIQAIKAVGKLKVTKSLSLLLDRVRLGGEEANLAANSAAKLGSEGIKGLQSLMSQVAPGLRRYIAAALTSAVGNGGAEASVAVLLDKDPQVAGAAANAIIGRVREMSAETKKQLAGELVAVLSDKKNKIAPVAEFSIIRVLAALNEPSATTIFWERTGPPYAPEVRALALQTLGTWIDNPTKDQWKKLFASAVETDFRIAAPALMILQKLPVSDKQLPDWIALFDAPDVAARRVAVEKLGERDSAPVAQGLMAQLKHADQTVRDVARTRLAKLEHGRKALIAAILEVDVLDELWQLARLVAPFAKEFAPASRTEILNRACKFLEDDDHRCDPLFFALREGDAPGLRDQLLERAVAKRKKKDYPTAMQYLKLLARDPAVGFEVRLELALVGLKLSSKDIAMDSRTKDPCLRQFTNVVATNLAEVQKTIEKAKWLEPEDLFYLGFHFAELFNQEKAFGAAVLQHLVKSSPKAKVSTNARNKLKSIVLK